MDEIKVVPFVNENYKKQKQEELSQMDEKNNKSKSKFIIYKKAIALIIAGTSLALVLESPVKNALSAAFDTFVEWDNENFNKEAEEYKRKVEELQNYEFKDNSWHIKK